MMRLKQYYANARTTELLKFEELCNRLLARLGSGEKRLLYHNDLCFFSRPGFLETWPQSRSCDGEPRSFVLEVAILQSSPKTEMMDVTPSLLAFVGSRGISLQHPCVMVPRVSLYQPIGSQGLFLKFVSGKCIHCSFFVWFEEPNRTCGRFVRTVTPLLDLLMPGLRPVILTNSEHSISKDTQALEQVTLPVSASALTSDQQNPSAQSAENGRHDDDDSYKAAVSCASEREQKAHQQKRLPCSTAQHVACLAVPRPRVIAHSCNQRFWISGLNREACGSFISSEVMGKMQGKKRHHMLGG
jgi:hypothetical protein